MFTSVTRGCADIGDKVETTGLLSFEDEKKMGT